MFILQFIGRLVTITLLNLGGHSESVTHFNGAQVEIKVCLWLLTENLTAPSQRASLFHQSPAPATNHSVFKEDTHSVSHSLPLYLLAYIPVLMIWLECVKTSLMFPRCELLSVKRKKLKDSSIFCKLILKKCSASPQSCLCSLCVNVETEMACLR